jgi:hypothetical protein
MGYQRLMMEFAISCQNLKKTGCKTKRGCQKLGMKVKLVWPNWENT